MRWPRQSRTEKVVVVAAAQMACIGVTVCLDEWVGRIVGVFVNLSLIAHSVWYLQWATRNPNEVRSLSTKVDVDGND